MDWPMVLLNHRSGRARGGIAPYRRELPPAFRGRVVALFNFLLSDHSDPPNPPTVSLRLQFSRSTSTKASEY